MNCRGDFDTVSRRSAVSHPPVDAPLCSGCRQSDLALFDPSCPGCQEIVKNPKTVIPEIFAIIRQWVPQTQKNIELFVNEILRRGAHVDDRDGLTDMTLLQYSCKAGAAAVGDVNSALRVVKMLIEKGADIHLRCRWTDMNALHYATHFDVAPILRFILKGCKEINVNTQCPNYDGGTALHIAARNLCLEATKVLLEYNADVSMRDNMSRTPLDCIPDISSFFLIPDIQDKVTKMQNLLAYDLQTVAESPGNRKANSVSGKAVLKALNLQLNDKVLISGCKIGVLRYCGSTEFASGIWAGIELDDNKGKNDGSVNSVTYFKCPPNNGIFVPISKVCRVNEVSTVKASSSFRNVLKLQVNHRKVDVSHITPKICTGINQDYEQMGLKIGDRVPIPSNRNDENIYGTIRYIGKIAFAAGCWVGIELDKEASDRHDGMIGGIHYFECPPHKGIYILASKLTRNLAANKDMDDGKENTVHKWKKRNILTRSQSVGLSCKGTRSSLLRSISVNHSLNRTSASPFLLSNDRSNFTPYLGMTILYNNKLDNSEGPSNPVILADDHEEAIGEEPDLGTMPTMSSGGSGINFLYKILKTVEMMKMDISHQSRQIEEILQRLRNKGEMLRKLADMPCTPVQSLVEMDQLDMALLKPANLEYLVKKLLFEAASTVYQSTFNMMRKLMDQQNVAKYFNACGRNNKITFKRTKMFIAVSDAITQHHKERGMKEEMLKAVQDYMKYAPFRGKKSI